MNFLIFLIGLAVAPITFALSLDQAEFKSIENKKMNLSAYKGKPMLVVNIATQCGYTGQLEGLEAIYKKYKQKNLVVVGIPSNDFGGQTPESNKDVKKFCKLNYGVTFPLTAKNQVSGKDKHPFVAQLVAASKGANEIKWNFEKFLIGKNGQLIARFPSNVAPDNKTLIKAIEGAL